MVYWILQDYLKLYDEFKTLWYVDIDNTKYLLSVPLKTRLQNKLYALCLLCTGFKFLSKAIDTHCP